MINAFLPFNKQGQSPVGGDCYRTILNPIFKIKFCFSFMCNVGAMAIAPYGFLNIKSLLARLYFVPILLMVRWKIAPLYNTSRNLVFNLLKQIYYNLFNQLKNIQI